MTSPGDAAPHEAIDRYLARLRGRLRGISDAAGADIVDEIRSHLLDRAAASGPLTADSVAEAIAALGNPEDLARAYLDDETLARARPGRSPSVVGFLMLAVSLVGTLGAAAFVLCALLKPIHPDAAGLWLLPDSDLELSLRMGFGTPPAGGRELLGWWIIPLGVMVAIGMVVITVRIGLLCTRLMARPRLRAP